MTSFISTKLCNQQQAKLKAEIDRLKAEREALKVANEELREARKGEWRLLDKQDAEDEIESLKRDCDRLTKQIETISRLGYADARRYRVIKNHAEPWRISRFVSQHRNDGKDLDDLVDRFAESIDDLKC